MTTGMAVFSINMAAQKAADHLVKAFLRWVARYDSHPSPLGKARCDSVFRRYPAISLMAPEIARDLAYRNAIAANGSQTTNGDAAFGS